MASAVQVLPTLQSRRSQQRLRHGAAGGRVEGGGRAHWSTESVEAKEEAAKKARTPERGYRSLNSSDSWPLSDIIVRTNLAVCVTELAHLVVDGQSGGDSW